MNDDVQPGIQSFLDERTHVNIDRLSCLWRRDRYCHWQLTHTKHHKIISNLVIFFVLIFHTMFWFANKKIALLHYVSRNMKKINEDGSDWNFWLDNQIGRERERWRECYPTAIYLLLICLSKHHRLLQSYIKFSEDEQFWSDRRTVIRSVIAAVSVWFRQVQALISTNSTSLTIVDFVCVFNRKVFDTHLHCSATMLLMQVNHIDYGMNRIKCVENA